MKKSMIAALIAFTVLFAADGSAELYKCVRDGKTTYQEQPCGAQGAETKIQTSKPSPWVGCYDIKKGEGTERWEVRQEGSTLYTTDGEREGPYEVRLIWEPASPRQSNMMKKWIVGKEKAEIEVTSGLVMSGAVTGFGLKKDPLGAESVIGFWWVRGLDIEGDPLQHMPRTKETLRASKEVLYIFAPYGFEKVNKVPCAKSN